MLRIGTKSLLEKVLQKAARRMKKWADKGRRPLEFSGVEFAPKLRVFRKREKGLLPRTPQSGKGPFPIVIKVGNVAYQ